jgi:hypothetical protein
MASPMPPEVTVGRILVGPVRFGESLNVFSTEYANNTVYTGGLNMCFVNTLLSPVSEHCPCFDLEIISKEISQLESVFRQQVTRRVGSSSFSKGRSSYFLHNY